MNRLLFRMLCCILIIVGTLNGLTFPLISAGSEQTRLRVAIIEFEIKGDIDIRDAGTMVAEMLITELGKTNEFDLKERILLQKVLREQSLATSGVIDEGSAVKIGKLYGVEAIITGSVMKWGKTIRVNARLVDTESGSIIHTYNIEAADINDVPLKMANLAHLVTEKVKQPRIDVGQGAIDKTMKAEREAKIKAELEARIQAEREAKLKAEQEARLKAEQETKLKAELEAKLKAEQEAKLQAEQEARLKAEQEAKLKEELEAKLKAEQEANRKAEEEAKLQAEQEAKLKAELEAKLQAEQEAKLRAEQEAKLKAEQEAKLKAELEAQLKAEKEARLQAEQEARLQAEQEAKLKAEQEAKLKAELEAKLKVEQEARRKAEQDANLKAEQDAKLKLELEAKLKAEQEAKLKAEQGTISEDKIADISGKWIVKPTKGDFPEYHSLTWELKQEGKKITGRQVSHNGATTPITGTVNGDTAVITLTFIDERAIVGFLLPSYPGSGPGFRRDMISHIKTLPGQAKVELKSKPFYLEGKSPMDSLEGLMYMWYVEGRRDAGGQFYQGGTPDAREKLPPRPIKMRRLVDE